MKLFGRVFHRVIKEFGMKIKTRDTVGVGQRSLIVVIYYIVIGCLSRDYLLKMEVAP